MQESVKYKLWKYTICSFYPFGRGAETRGDKGYIPPIIWLYPNNSLRMVHICIPSNSLNGCTSERKFGKKKCSILVEDLFFLVSTWIWGKKRSIFDEDLFFSLHLNLGKKVFHLLFFLVFTKFPHLNKIVVEVHPPNEWNRAKLG